MIKYTSVKKQMLFIDFHTFFAHNKWRKLHPFCCNFENCGHVIFVNNYHVCIFLG